MRPRRQWRERLAQRNVDKGGEKQIKKAKGTKEAVNEADKKEGGLQNE